jgi:CRISPR-associated protein Cmr4
MNTQIVGLLAETSIHPGAGQSSGVIDLPVAREAATDYPFVPGSSVKGALLGLARKSGKLDAAERDRVFGKAESGNDGGGAGALLISDARLLLLPVRSLSSAYKWVTCPHLLERFARDARRGGNPPATLRCEVSEGNYFSACDGDLFLEERQFSRGGPLPDKLVETLEILILHEKTRARLASQVVVLHDDDFVWFARYGLAVQARNALDEKKKTSTNLWYEETIPPDALFYSLLAERQGGAIAEVKQLFNNHPYLQIGGNETVGMGWFAVAFPNEKGGGK